MDALQFLHDYWGYAVVAGPGLFAMWKQWQAGKQAVRKDRADLIGIAQEAAGQVIADLRKELERLRADYDEVRSELNDVRKENTRMIADKDAKITLLEGELRQWKATAEAYERLLEANNIPHLKSGQTVWEAKAAGLLPQTSAAADPGVGAGR